MSKTIIEKLERKKTITWMLIWLNWSVTTINVTLQLLDIYIYIYKEREREREITFFKREIENKMRRKSIK